MKKIFVRLTFHWPSTVDDVPIVVGHPLTIKTEVIRSDFNLEDARQLWELERAPSTS